MESKADFFHCLPEEVTQLIFSRIKDYKALIQCMSVSKLFRQQAVRVPSLSIVCPGNFSSYDERLHRVFSMVKAFKNLKSLVVRVGQPRDERPSWARCMRYAEIGGTVEKFIFMAAKRGEFSQLDSTLLGLKRLGESSYSLGASWWPSVHIDVEIKGGLEKTGGCSHSSSCLGVVDSKAKGINMGLSEGVLDAGSNQMQQGKCLVASLETSTETEPLSQFSLHQVIAPSDDVLKRMLPVIHIAIVQGLNELRDSLPAFVVQFTELRAFLLVDMVESITVFMRDHHIQELRSSHLQELNEVPGLGKGGSQVDVYVSDNTIGGGVENTKKDEEHLSSDCEKSGGFEVLDLRCTNGVQRTEDAPSGHKTVGKHGSSPSRNTSVLDFSPSNIVSTSRFQAFDTKSLQTSNVKENFAEEFDSVAEGRLSACNRTPLHFNRGSLNNLDNCASYLQDNWGTGCSDGPTGLESSHLGCIQDKQSAPKNRLESFAGSKAFDVTKPETPVWPEAITEGKYSVGSSLNNEGEVHNKVTGNVYRPQGTRCLRNCKTDLTSKCSLRRWFKPDSLKKKDCKTLRFSTGLRGAGGLHSRSFLEENWNSSSEMRSCNHDAFGKDKQPFSDELPFGNGDNGKSCVSCVEEGDHDTLAANIDDYGSSSNKLGSNVEFPEGNEHQTFNNVPLSSQAWQPEIPGSGRERMAYGDFWQERVQKLRDSLHAESSLDIIQTRHGRRAQSLELTASEAAEGSGHADNWRHAWQERVRRLRGSLHMNPGEERDQTLESQRGLRDISARKPHKCMETEALSFDYTFWRAEQVSSGDCVVSDVSMCIATHAARPLKDFEKEVLIQAAIAGPLLVATVSHVNSHHASHQL